MVTGPRTDSYRINFGIQKDSHPARLTVAPGRPTFWCSDTRARAPARRPFIPFVLYTGPPFCFFYIPFGPCRGGSPFSVGFLFSFFFYKFPKTTDQYNKSGAFPALLLPTRGRSSRSVVAGGPSRNFFRPSSIFVLAVRDVFSKTGNN